MSIVEKERDALRAALAEAEASAIKDGAIAGAFPGDQAMRTNTEHSSLAERLVKERDAAVARADEWREHHDRADHRAFAYAQEIERLKEALELIIANPAFRAESIARAALEAKP